LTKKYKLDYNPEFDFLLLGIVSFERDYRLSWEINEILHLDLERVDDHIVKHKKTGSDLHFSCFIFNDENSYLNFKLLSNRSDKGALIEDVKNLDYLMVISGEYSDSFALDLKTELIKLETVQSCFILDPEKIKNSEIVL
jgi:hypothetical protein